MLLLFATIFSCKQKVDDNNSQNQDIQRPENTCKVNIEPPDTSGYKSVKIYIIEGAYYVYGKD